MKATDFLPTSILEGDSYQVIEAAQVDGPFVRFTISSPYGQFPAYGAEMVRIRIQEIHALVELETLGQSTAFSSGVKDGLLAPIVFLSDLVTSPLETASRFGKGIWRATASVREMVVSDRSTFEESEAKELIGFSQLKRKLAYRLGVDVYSSNQVLQDKLNELSWAAYAGDMGSLLLTLPLTGPASAAVMGASFSNAMTERIRDSSPEDLRRRNRDRLEQVNVPEAVIDAFLQHPWYSPRAQSNVVDALSQMKDVNGLDRCIQAALTAGEEPVARFFERSVMMMARIHQEVIPFTDILLVDGRILLGYSEDEALVAVAPLTYLPWTRGVAQTADAVTIWSSALPVRRLELWTTGQLSDKARRALEERGVTVFDASTERLRPSFDDHPANG